jgi:outer membrane protein
MTLSFLLLSVAMARDVSMDDALQAAWADNTDVASAMADVLASEGRELSSRGVGDVQLGLSANYSPMVSEGRGQGFVYRLDQAMTGWGTSLSQSLPTGTTWNLKFDGVRTPPAEYNFSVSGQDFTETTDTTHQTNLAFEFSQQLLAGHRLSYNLRSISTAENATTQAELRLQSARIAVGLETARSYWDLALAAGSKELAENAVAVATEEARVVSALLEGGSAAPVDAARAASALASAELSLLDSEEALLAAMDNLARLTGWDVGEELVPNTEPGDVQVGLSVDMQSSIDATLASNPNVALQGLALAQAEAEVSWARHATLPNLSLVGQLGWSGYEEGSISASLAELTSMQLPSHFVGVEFNAPLGNRASTGALHTQVAMLAMAQASAEASTDALVQQVAAAVRTLQSASQRVELSDRTVDLAQQTLAAEVALRDAGRGLEREVLQAQSSLIQMRLNALRARVDYRKALVELQGLRGEFGQ